MAMWLEFVMCEYSTDGISSAAFVCYAHRPVNLDTERIFSWLHELDVVSFAEAAQTFNLGLGMILAVDAKDVRKVLAHFKKSRWPAWEVGRIVRSAKTCLVSVEAEEGEAVLEY